MEKTVCMANPGQRQKLKEWDGKLSLEKLSCFCSSHQQPKTITNRMEHQFFVLLLTSLCKMLMFCCAAHGPDTSQLLSNTHSLLRDSTHPPFSLLVRHSKYILDICKSWNIFNIFFPSDCTQSKIPIFHNSEPRTGKWEQCDPGAGKSLLSVENYKIWKY